jgi:hypothetical protein
LSISLTLSLEHLAPLWTPVPPSSALLARAEGAILGAMAESNLLLAGEMVPCLDGVQGVEEKNEVLESLKGEVVDTLVFARAVKAHMA